MHTSTIALDSPATDRAVEQLTETHTEHTEAGPVEWPPLLEWLETSVTEIMGRSGGSGSGGGVPFNAEAAALLKRIDKQLRLMVRAVGDPGGITRIDRVAAMWQFVCEERKGNRLDDAQWYMFCTEFPDWVARIKAEDDRPHKVELTAPCPRCGDRWVLDNGDRIAAVMVSFKTGQAPIAECRNDDCGAIWAGWEQMAQLGYTVGATQDLAVLAACGINLNFGITTM